VSAGNAAGTAARNQLFLFLMDLCDLMKYRFIVKTDIRNGRKKPFCQDPVGTFRGYHIPACGTRKSDQRACKFILQIGGVGSFAAHPGIACAAGTAGCLFTLKAEHFLVHFIFLRYCFLFSGRSIHTERLHCYGGILKRFWFIIRNQSETLAGAIV
jgi:hypothetical protein